MKKLLATLLLLLSVGAYALAPAEARGYRDYGYGGYGYHPYVQKALIGGGIGAVAGGLLGSRDPVGAGIKGALLGSAAGLGYEYLRQSSYGGGYRGGYGYGGGGYGGYRHGYGNYYHPPYYRYHNNWYHGGWSGWNYLPSIWTAAALSGWLGGSSFVYSNPYFVDVPAAGPYYINYAVPISVPEYAYESALPVYAPEEVVSPVLTDPPIVPETEPEPVAPADPNALAAERLVGVARDQFRRNDYLAAQRTVEEALAKTPGDPALHEFRALTLFAQQKYRDSAAALYAVLAVGPGMNWETLQAFYADPAIYTQQLDALQLFVQANPTAADARFVLAYHALVLGQYETALLYYEEVVRLQPADNLSAQILDALRKSKEAGERALEQR